jgi:hypothetical protein
MTKFEEKFREEFSIVRDCPQTQPFDELVFSAIIGQIYARETLPETANVKLSTMADWTAQEVASFRNFEARVKRSVGIINALGIGVRAEVFPSRVCGKYSAARLQISHPTRELREEWTCTKHFALP